MKMTQGLCTAVLAVGLAALTAPAIAQTGSPNATGSQEILQNQPPKGNIGTSSQDPGGERGTMSGSPSGSQSSTSGAGSSGMGSGSNMGSGSQTTPASPNPSANQEIQNNVPPKGNIGTSSQSPGGPAR